MTPIPPLRLDLPYYSVTELAAACGVGRSTVQRWLADERLSYDERLLGRECFSAETAAAFNVAVWTQRAERGNS